MICQRYTIVLRTMQSDGAHVAKDDVLGYLTTEPIQPCK